MTSLTHGASPRLPASPSFVRATAPASGPGADIDLQRPALAWPRGRGLLLQALTGGFLLVAKPLIAWQQRLEEQDRIRRLPDHLLQDVGLTRADLGINSEYLDSKGPAWPR